MEYLLEKMMGMKLIRIATVTVLLAVSMAAGTAMAQDTNTANDNYAAETHKEAPAIEAAADSMGPWKAFAYVGACLGAGLGVIGGGMGIGKIAGSATEGIARQPEAAGQMFLAWLIPAAMIEGMALFAIVICLMIATK